MIKPYRIKRGDTAAVVSLSSGILGEDFCRWQLELGKRRLEELGLRPRVMPNALRGIEYLKAHPEARAQDLKDAFYDDDVRMIVCAIGGDDTYRLLPFLMEDQKFKAAVVKAPKVFTGFSDSTVNHLMLYKLGLQSFYGPNFMCDLAEYDTELLPYTRRALESYFENPESRQIMSAGEWYEEREEFTAAQLGKPRRSHREERGYEVLQGSGSVRGRLLGGCLETLYDMLTDSRYPDQREVCGRYGIFPDREEWRDKLIFLETCEETPPPELLREELLALKELDIFGVAGGVLVGKPMNEVYYEEYKEVYRSVIDDVRLPVLYNVNFGHAFPRCVLPYGCMAEMDLDRRTLWIREKVFAEGV